MQRLICNPIFYKALGDVTGKSICDIACGSGYYFEELLKRGASEITGIDISEGMLELAKAKATALVTVMHGDMSDEKFLEKTVKEKQFDIAFSAWGLYYMETDEAFEAALANVFKCIKPGGKALFMLEDDKSLYNSGLTKTLIKEFEYLEVRGDFTTGTTY